MFFIIIQVLVIRYVWIVAEAKGYDAGWLAHVAYCKIDADEECKPEITNDGGTML